MRFIIVNDIDELSRVGASFVIDQIREKSNTVLGLATGSTPVGLYKCLIDEHKKGLDFSKVITFNLDEYFGLSPDHPQSYRYFMGNNLFNHININKGNIHIPNGMCKNIEEECQRYDKAIAEAGGVDLQILGIGRNGHIGFNEPDDMLEVRTHLTGLTKDTIEANSRFFNTVEEVPKTALTMGLGTIMNSRKIILLASGADKAKVVSKIAKPYIDTDIPASVLQLHSNVIVIVDKEAAAYISHEDLNGIAV
jgi:glucosamine-6-phosphate deaminase